MGLFDFFSDLANNAEQSFNQDKKRKTDNVELWRDISSSDRFRKQGSSNWMDREDWATDNKPSKSGGFDIYEDNDGF